MEDITIVMPVKNGAAYLTDSLRSIRSQTLSSWELILIDDHSRDQSADVIRDFAREDSRITCYLNRGNGIVSALESALENAKGKFITRMDSDDMMPPTRLELMINQIKPKHIITGNIEYFSNEHSISPGYLTYQEWLNENLASENPWSNIYRECIVASPNWMMMVDELKQIGGFTGLIYPEDYDLTFRWYKNGFMIRHIPETTLFWRDHSERTSRNSDNYSQKSFFNLKIKRFLELDDSGGELILWGKGPKLKLTCKILKKHSRPFQVMTLDNFRLIEKTSNPQLLICVYPEHKKRKEIVGYLKTLDMKMGTHYWFL